MMDGSARRVRDGGFLREYPFGEGEWPGSFHINAAQPTLHTIGGVSGRDIP